MEKRLGFVGIIIEDRQRAAPLVNEVLTAFGECIVARTGIPYASKHCCVITLIVDATTDQVGDYRYASASSPASRSSRR